MFKSKNFIFISIILLCLVIGFFINFIPSLFSYEAQLEDKSHEYKITSFDVEIDVSKDNVLTITESIDVDFNVSSQGIFRMLPETNTVSFFDKNNQLVSKNYRVKYNVLETNETFLVESYDGFFVIVLGERGTFLNGANNYQIKYTASLGNDRIAELDHFYYNVIGQYWNTTIENISVNINFPEKVVGESDDETAEINARTGVYVGEYGSTETIDFSWNAEGTQLSFTYEALNVGEGITARVALDEGYFQVPFDNWLNVINLILIVTFAVLALYLYKKYSNPKMVVPVVQFSANEKYTPADVGYIMDRKVDNKDIASLIIYWAQKGYIEIVEKDKSTFLRKLKNPDDADLKIYEKTFFNAIFKNKYENINDIIKNTENKETSDLKMSNRISEKQDDKNNETNTTKNNEKNIEKSKNKDNSLLEINEIGKNIVTDIAEIKTDIENLNKPLFNAKAVAARFAIIFIMGILVALIGGVISYQKVIISDIIISVLSGILVTVALLFIAKNKDTNHFISKWGKIIFAFNLLIAFTSVSAFFILIFEPYFDFLLTSILVMIEVVFIGYLVFKFNVRTDEGLEELGDIVGLKNFIEVAEKDRLEMLVQENPSAFYVILPYAYVLGVYEKWCKKFEKITIDAPQWYVGSGDIDLFNTMIFIHVLNNSCNQLLHSIDAAKIANLAQGAKSLTDGTGGFGGGFGGFGGGFAGGGFGGGGGGRW